MFLTTFPFKYYALLPDYTLTTKIRQESWNLDKIFPLLKSKKSELKELAESIKSNPSNILKVRHAIYSLTIEIKLGFKDLKFINFYDSALLYLYYRLLHHVYDLCKKEESRLIEEKQKEISKEKNLDEHAENIKIQKESLEKSINEHAKLIKKFDAAKKGLVKDYENLVNELRKRRWDAEKQAQHEFTLLKFTLRSMENLNRKIKVEAIKTKSKIVPKKADLMLRIRTKISPDDVIQLAKLVSEAIERISKDVYYSSKLISKFEREMERLERIVENLKKTINKLLKDDKQREKIAENLFKLWDKLIEKTEKEINRDLMRIFGNIVRLYKYVGTRQF